MPTIKPLRQNATDLPLPRELEKREDWEREVFNNADHFTASKRAGVGAFETKEFATLREALLEAHYLNNGELKRDLGVMVYVVSKDGRSFCIPPKDWLHYLLLSEESKHGI